MSRLRITSQYHAQLVLTHPKSHLVGPGLDEDPVAQIVLGYYVADAGYISVIFDTRPDAESDGECSKPAFLTSCVARVRRRLQQLLERNAG